MSPPVKGVPKYQINKRLPGTCTWLLDSQVYTDWLDSSRNSVLWIVGKPGSGKSTLARFVVDTLENSSNNRPKSLSKHDGSRSNELVLHTPRVLFFFCSYAEPLTSAVDVLRSLLHQLVSSQPSLLEYISLDERLHCAHQMAPAAQLGGLLADIAANISIYIIIDALDECEGPIRNELLNALAPGPDSSRSLGPAHPLDPHPPHSFMKILYTRRWGRSEVVVEQSVDTIDLSQAEEAAYVEQDIRLYVRSRLSQWSQHPSLTDAERNEIEDQLMESANGVFLWVSLTLEALFGHDPSFGFRSVLLHTPRNLEDFYRRELRLLQWSLSEPNPARTLLLYILEAKRPLTLSELSEATVFSIDPHSQGSFSPYLPRITNTLNALNGRLITIDGYDSTVQFVHQTAKEFLERSQLVDVSSNYKVRQAEQTTLAHACVCYLVHRSVQNYDTQYFHGSSLVERNFRAFPGVPLELTREFPFFEYAAMYWSEHVNSIHNKHIKLSNFSLQNFVHNLSDPYSSFSRTWFPIYWLGHTRETWERTRFPEYPTELILWVFLGHETRIRHLLWQKAGAVDERTRAGVEWNPLMAAAWMGNESIVDLLIDHHAGENTTPETNSCTLVQAIERGHLTIARKLISHFTKVPQSSPCQRTIFDAPVREGSTTPLIASVVAGSKELVRYCLERGADVNPHRLLDYPVQPTVKITILDTGVTLPATPLHTAISTGSIEMLRLLLDAGANLDGSDSLGFAALSESDAVLKMLLDHGANINDRVGQISDGWTPLHFAASYGSRKRVEKMLLWGAEPHSRNDSGQTPLQLALSFGHVEVSKALLQVSTPGSMDIGTALSYAVRRGYYDLAECLIEKDDSLNTLGTIHGTSIHGTSILETLLDPEDEKCSVARTPLVLRLPHPGSRLSVLKMLLNHGVDFNQRNTEGNTSLHRAVSGVGLILLRHC